MINNQWRPVERKLGQALTGVQGTQSQNHLGRRRVFMFTGPRKAGVPEIRWGRGEVEGRGFFLVGKSPVSPASQNTWNHEGQQVLPSCGQAPRRAVGSGCCPGCTGSYSQPGCAPAGASPRLTSFQNRCGFWNGKRQGNSYTKTTPRKSIYACDPPISSLILPMPDRPCSLITKCSFILLTCSHLHYLRMVLTSFS